MESETTSLGSSPGPSPLSSAGGSILTSRGRPRKSPVWNYFVYDSEKETSMCKVEVKVGERGPSKTCDHVIGGKFPTNLKNHLKKHHPTQYEELLQKEEEARKAKEEAKARAKAKAFGPHKQLTMVQSLSGRPKYDRDSQRYTSITKRLAVFVGATNTPNSIVENSEFQRFMESLDPRYPIPSRTLLNKELDKVMFDLKATIQTYMSMARKISLCTDIWSKRGLTSSYLGITAHFFSSRDHRRHCVTLAVRRLLGSHTAEVVKETVEEVMKEWQIPTNKVNAIVTDNGSNMVAAFRSHFEEHGEDEEEIEEVEGIRDVSAECEDDEEEDFISREVDFEVSFSSFIKRVPCFAHTLQLVVRKFDQIAQYKAVLKNARSLVSKVNKSTKATEKLIALCNRKLVSDCCTRWSSTYLLVERLLLVRSAISSILDTLEWDNLPASEWKVLENVYNLLKPFAQYTNLISGEEYTTISAVIPIITEINLHLEAAKSVPDISHAASVLQSELQYRFKQYTDPGDAKHDPLFLVATFFDHRYKLILNRGQTESASREVQKLLKNQSEDPGSSSSSNTESPVYPDTDEPPLKKFCHLSKVLEKKWKESMKKTPKHIPGEQELQLYLSSLSGAPSVPDPVSMWLECANKYPTLSTLAIDTLIIPGSSAPIERVFSTAGNATTGKRNRLADKNLEREVLIRKNKDYLDL